MAIAAADTTGRRADRIESLLSARLFVEPQLVDDRITFASNLPGHLSLYAMDASGGVPEPLLPPQVALQNPDLVGGELFHVVPGLDRIVVMIDADGDENYVPYTIPAAGGFPEALAPEAFASGRSHLVHVDDAARIAYFAVESREESSIAAVRVDLASGVAESLWQSQYGAFVAAWTPDHSRVVLTDGYTPWPERPTRPRLVVAIIGNEARRESVPDWATTVVVPRSNEIACRLAVVSPGSTSMTSSSHTTTVTSKFDCRRVRPRVRAAAGWKVSAMSSTARSIRSRSEA